jgi:hypothetical protein
MSIDIQILNHGSLVLLKPTSDLGREWLESNIGQDNGYQPMWPTALVEPRYVSDIVDGAFGDGLEVR